MICMRYVYGRNGTIHSPMELNDLIFDNRLAFIYHRGKNIQAYRKNYGQSPKSRHVVKEMRAVGNDVENVETTLLKVSSRQRPRFQPRYALARQSIHRCT